MSENVFSILRRRYPAEEYTVMQEVSDTTGGRNQSADFIVMNLWRSRGCALQGIELKSYRGDWLNELKRPAKAENIFQYCDYWWLLTKDEAVAKIEEIPEAWGWMNIKNGKIFVRKPAPKLTPVPIIRPFLAAMLRRAGDRTGFIHRADIDERLKAEYEKGVADGEMKSGRTKTAYEELKKQVDDFVSASGIQLSHRWGSQKAMGDAVEFIQSGGAVKLKKDLIRLEQTAQSILGQISKGLKSVNAIQEVEPPLKLKQQEV